MFDIFKILAEEPQKIRRSIFILLKFTLNTIAASCLYVLIFKKYDLISFEHPAIWNEIYHFIISGNIIIVFFIYLVCNFLLFDILTIIPKFLLNFISKKIFSNNPDFKDNKSIRIILNVFNVIETDKNDKKIKIGHNFEEFYDLLFSYQHKETKQEIYSFRNSLMNETLHSYFVFVFVFILFINLEKSTLLNYLIGLGLVLNSILYMLLHFAIDFFNNNGENILYGLKSLQINEQVDTFLEENHFRFSKDDSPIKNNFSKMIYINKKEILLDSFFGKYPLPSRQIQRFINVTLNNDKENIVVLSNQKLTKKAKKLLKENNKTIAVLVYENEDDINHKLYNHFVDN